MCRQSALVRTRALWFATFIPSHVYTNLPTKKEKNTFHIVQYIQIYIARRIYGHSHCVWTPSSRTMFCWHALPALGLNAAFHTTSETGNSVHCPDGLGLRTPHLGHAGARQSCLPACRFQRGIGHPASPEATTAAGSAGHGHSLRLRSLTEILVSGSATAPGCRVTHTPTPSPDFRSGAQSR